MRVSFAIGLYLGALSCASGFVSQTEKYHKSIVQDGSFSESTALSSNSVNDDDSYPLNGFVSDVQTRYRIFQDSRADGDSFKQSLAFVMAGEYNKSEINTEVRMLKNSAPCVMFVWQNSPSCKSAIKAFDNMGVQYRLIKLDDPWEKGNKLRAELGKMTGKTSVPSIWINGEYVGGYDDGVSEESPGIVDLAFAGTLRDKLMKAGAIPLQVNKV